MLSRRTNLRTISSTMIEKAVPEPVRVGARAVRTVVSPILLLIAIYAAWLFTPVYFRKIGFEEAVRNIARAAAYNDHDESEIHEEIMRKARELRIPVKDENVLVSREKDAVRINTTYYQR